MFIKRTRPQKIKMRNVLKKHLFLQGGKIFFIILVILTVLCGVLWSLNFIKTKLIKNGFFDLNKSMIEIKGNKYLNENIYLDKIDFSEDKGKTIFDFSQKEYIKKLAEITELDSVSILKYYPNKIIIKIKERTPEFKVEIDNKILYVDKNLVVIKSYRSDLNFISIDQKMLENKGDFNILLDLKNILITNSKFEEISKNIQKMTIDENLNIKLILKNGKMIRLMSLSDYLRLKKDGTLKLVQILGKKFKFFGIVQDDLMKRNVNFHSINLKYFNSVDDFIVVEK